MISFILLIISNVTKLRTIFKSLMSIFFSTTRGENVNTTLKRKITHIQKEMINNLKFHQKQEVSTETQRDYFLAIFEICALTN